VLVAPRDEPEDAAAGEGAERGVDEPMPPAAARRRAHGDAGQAHLVGDEAVVEVDERDQEQRRREHEHRDGERRGTEACQASMASPPLSASTSG
jgi:hypothetical protein